MSKFFKGLMAGALVLSLMSPIAKGGEAPAPVPNPTQTVETYSYKNCLSNNLLTKLTLVGSFVAIVEGLYIGLDKAGIL